jgi:hypothetical protein
MPASIRKENAPYSDTWPSLRARVSRMRCRRPMACHSRYRSEAVSHLPHSSGSARHAAPERTAQGMPPSTVRWSWRGRRPAAGRWGGSNASTRRHSTSVSPAFADAETSGDAARPPARVSPRTRRRAAWQRAAAAWWARRHRDQPSRNGRRSAASPIASTSRRTSGTVSGIEPDAAPPFPRLLPAARLGARRPGRRAPTGRGSRGGARPPISAPRPGPGRPRPSPPPSPLRSASGCCARESTLRRR